MGIIRVLSEQTINQIAAGEVVERPASVVKELLENSIDADAKRLIIEIKGSGENYIRITDDGFGMDKDDARLAFERHATSKITRGEDLFDIHSFGFRGEAIASIASVSLMSLQTKKRGDISGTLLVSEGGVIKKARELGCAEGTQIEIQKLFYNTPARKKYLKNETTEYGHVVDVVSGIALAHPTIAVKLIHDNKVVFDLPATEDHLSRARALVGRQTADAMIPVFYGHSQISLTGYIGKPDIARANKKSQFLFVNDRQVNSHVLSYAVKQSFHSLLPKERYPVYLLFLNIAPELVDVNVHPRKTEVKFAQEKEIFKVFYSACQKSLEKYVLAPKLEFNGTQYGQGSDAVAERSHQAIAKVEEKADEVVAETINAAGRNAFNPVPAPVNTKMDFDMSVTVPKIGSGKESERNNEAKAFKNNVELNDVDKTYVDRKELKELEPLAQLNNSYILCRQGDGLVIIDQHAAHERVRYSEILDEFELKDRAMQQLLTPINIELQYQEMAVLEANNDVLQAMGFEIDHFGGNTFTVHAVPSYFRKEDVQAVVMGLIDDLNDGAKNGDLQERKERAIKYAACRSAVKFGDKLSMEEQVGLCKRIMEIDQPYSCPHGRPTMVSLSKDDLEKRFGRKY